MLHLPGHTPGSIALLEERTGTLYSGDIVYDGPLIDDAYHSNREDYVATMDSLRALPVSVIHGGHFPSFGVLTRRCSASAGARPGSTAGG